MIFPHIEALATVRCPLTSQSRLSASLGGSGIRFSPPPDTTILHRLRHNQSNPNCKILGQLLLILRPKKILDEDNLTQPKT